MKIFQRIVLLCFSVAVLAITFNTNYNNRLKTFESEAKSKEKVVNEYIEQSSTFIELMTTFGNQYLKTGNAPDSEIISLFQYDPEQDSYHLGAVGGTKYETTMSNLTGLGSLPDSGTFRDEINLALAYNIYYNLFHNRLPEITWLYYTSENDFINMYPWISSEDFTFTEKLHTIAYYTVAMPQNNALRQAVWAPVYLDEAGKGLMVTLSSPIYLDDTFRGVISLDLTTARLGELITSEFKSYLIDEENYVIAAGLNTSFEQQKTLFETLLNLSLRNVQNIVEIQNGSVQQVGSNYIYCVDFKNAPWRLYFFVSVWEVINLAVLYTVPILASCILLGLAFMESEKRKRTQIALSNSLEEIKSYHNLLENAAKHDFLTDTCNRRGLAEIFHDRIEVDNIKKIPVSFVMGDIDEFKNFNNTYGHTAGDRILVEITSIMKESITGNDVVCRWGGEEFVIMLLDIPYKGAIQMVEKLRKKIETNVISWAGAVELRATMTFGVAEYDYTESMQASISKADSAMYIGKRQGRNRVSGYKG